MRLILLSDKFYIEHSQCIEILQKRDRPYACLTMTVDGVQFAIPFRHHISHPYAFITYGTCGLDFSKSVVIGSEDDIAKEPATVDSKEWNIVRRSENKIFFSFRAYIRQYRRAMEHREKPRSEAILKYSSLQYFEEYL